MFRKEHPLGGRFTDWESKTITAYSATNGEREGEGVEVEGGMIAQ
jgi:hypothetical protein